MTFSLSDFSGYLVKKGGGRSPFGRKNWKKRWFCLQGTNLTYKKSFKSKKVLGSIELPAVTSLSTCDSDEHRFEIVTPGRTYVIHARDTAMKRAWMCKLRTLTTGSAT